MALDKPGLKAAIKAALKEQSTKTSNPEEAMDIFAERLASAIDVYVKTGQVNTVGGPTAQTGTIT